MAGIKCSRVPNLGSPLVSTRTAWKTAAGGKLS
eukprot:CAMPEP_0204494758 /NCGR_PEP_ID=MMETSP0471-20130131/85023_1 /ASSEMBLY_ACC=CAM_ASM_000602 /TAXON_ID=2969 /ORGANISM="Oxyrrhis marina" /LENGTH=32 /DNA_ID= /DNA_START= /DNA_END= /DNA_ORIENTATION=